MIPVSTSAAILLALGLAVFATNLTTIYLHRAVAHGSVILKPWLHRVCAWLNMLLTGVRTRRWAAVHLYHHLYTDRDGEPGDPHSPHLEGLWHIVFFNMYYYAKASHDPRVFAHPVVQRRLAKLAPEPLDRIGPWGLPLLLVLSLVVLGWRAGLVFFWLYFVVLVLLTGAVNGVAHFRGYKNFPTAPAFNLRLLALVTGGEGLHNNHHARFANPFFAYRAAEWLWDTGGWVIRLLCVLGWAELAKGGR